MRKRLIAFVLVILFVLSVLTGNTGIYAVDHAAVKEVRAASGNVSMSRILKECEIPVVGRDSSEGLWCIRVDGKKTFCLNSGKTMNKGDHASGKTHEAASYSNQSLAKVLTYYFGEKEQKGGTKLFLLCQAYVWACGKGVNKKTAMIQAGKNISVSAAEAARVYQEIQGTDPYGKITYYTITKCAREKKSASHQHLLTWSGSRPTVSYGSYREPYTAVGDETITVMVTKKDVKTEAKLENAVFDLYRDGQKVASVTTGKDGCATYVYKASYTVTVPAEAEYIWVKNWNTLSAEQQQEEKNKGHYASEAQAIAACKQDLQAKAEALLDKKKKEVHSWKAVEVKAPANYSISGAGEQIKTEEAATDTLSFLFMDQPVRMSLKLCKKSEEEGSPAYSLKGAVYGLYAAENIYKSDHQTVVCQKDALVTRMTTDENGVALAEGLLPAKYYLLEQIPPVGYEKDQTKHSVDLSYTSGSSLQRTITVADRPIKNKVYIKKTFAGETFPTDPETKEQLPITDAFCLINADGDTVSSFTIGEDGYGESQMLPYGTYILRQTKETQGYDKVPDRMIKIEDSAQKIQLSLDDPLKEARIYLTKYRTVTDAETNTFIKEAEAGAEFALYGPDEQLIMTARAEDDGVVYFGEIHDLGRYRIHQISGTFGYQLMEDQFVNVTEKTSYFVTGEDSFCGDKIRIKKFLSRKEQEEKEPEALAEFVILDAANITETKDELSAMDNMEERMDYLLDIYRENSQAIIAELRTDNQGKAAVLLTDWQCEKHPEGFIVLQTWGEEGYELCPPIYSKDIKTVVEEGIQVYEIEAVDHWNDWASISLKKYMTTGEDTYVPEALAEFAVIDENEQTVAVKKTGEDGSVLFEGLEFGTYRIEQVSGDSAHIPMEPVYVTLSQEDRHQTIPVAKEGVIDREKEIQFTLIKMSEETGILLDGAQYQLYSVKKEEKDGQKETRTLVAALCTGMYGEETKETSGKATCSLPYGTYVLKEIYPAQGYLLNEKEYRFVLDRNSVSYDEDGNGTYVLEVTDRPVMGKISLEKKGNALTGYVEESQSFVCDTEPVAGAVYGLYAQEDICRDDGQVVYAADTLIDQKTTDTSGKICFTRTDEAGKLTDRFYLGNYYVREISAPEGYVLDPEKYMVRLTWDGRAEQFKDIKKVEPTKEVEPPLGNNSPDPEEGKYILKTGAEMNQLFREKKVTSVSFTWEEAPEGAVLTNVSSDKGDGIVFWTEGTEGYVSTQLAGQVMYLNTQSQEMFANCTDLKDISFANTDTSRIVDFGRMFYRCTGLETLDLSSFNMKNAENVSRMFAYCSSLTTVLVNDQVLGKEELYEEDIPSRIEAKPQNDVIVGHTFCTEDFAFTMFYENGKEEEIYPTQTEAEFSPQRAGEAGEMTVRISFTGTGRYAEFGTIEVPVQVTDPDTIPIERVYTEPEVTVSLEDEQQSITIQIIKADAKDPQHEMLEGAEFTLYAGCDIVNKKGEILFQRDEIIATQISGDSDFSYVEFSHLPSQLYKKDKTEPWMYYVRETKAPEGYDLNDKVVYISGKTEDQAKAEFIYGYSEENIQNAESIFVGMDELLYDDTRIPYITLKKQWCGDSIASRPDSIQVSVTLADGTEKRYVLSAEKNWQLVTDIEPGMLADTDKDQFLSLFRENVPEGYQEYGSYWNPGTNTYVFRNVSEKEAEVSVEKIWEDKNNSDGIRPDSVTVGLYGNEQLIKTVVLPTKDGEWCYTETDLPVADDTGMVIDYTWRELTGSAKENAAEAYLSLTEKDEHDPSKIIITNFHEVKTMALSIQKRWEDEEDRQNIRPDSVAVQLLADGLPVKVRETEQGLVYDETQDPALTDTILLTAENGWCETVTELPVSKGDQEIKYIWKEILQDEQWITGESLWGYEASYETDPLDVNRTILTNTHTFFTGASVKVNKKIQKENLSFTVDLPTFVFTLAGEDIYGNPQKFVKKVTFTPEDVSDIPDEGTVTKSVTFTDIPMGNYTLSESGMEGIYVQESLESLTEGSRSEGNEFKITVGPTLEESKNVTKDQETVSWNQEVVFENKAVRGSVLLKKLEEDEKTVLPGVAFTLKNKDASIVLTAVTDEQGQILFTDLQPGEYTLTETATKEGNTLLAEPVQIKIPLCIEDTPGEEKTTAADAVKYGEHRYLYQLKYTITNHAVLTLPRTGGFEHWADFWPIVTAGAMILAGIWIWHKKDGLKRKKNQQSKADRSPGTC